MNLTLFGILAGYAADDAGELMTVDERTTEGQRGFASW